MTDPRYRRPSLVPMLLVIGAWLIVTLMISLAIPGQVALGFLAGAVIGWPLFYPVSSYCRRWAAADVAIRERRFERSLGGHEQLARARRRVGAALGLDGPGPTREILHDLGVVLKWTPAALTGGLSLLGVLAAERLDGGQAVDATAMAMSSGVGAAFAVLFYRRASRMPAPGGRDAEQIVS